MFNLNFRKTRLKVKPENLGPLCLCSEFSFQVGKMTGSNMLYAFGNSREVKMDCLLPKYRKGVNWMITRYNLWRIFFLILWDCLKQERCYILLLGLP